LLLSKSKSSSSIFSGPVLSCLARGCIGALWLGIPHDCLVSAPFMGPGWF
jgi:hypothetical protein